MLAVGQQLQLDLRLARPFAVGRNGRLELFVQVFNVLDRANYGAVDGRVLSPTLGRPIGLAGPLRTIELGVRDRVHLAHIMRRLRRLTPVIGLSRSRNA